MIVCSQWQQEGILFLDKMKKIKHRRKRTFDSLITRCAQVVAIIQGGAFAEECVADVGSVFKVPGQEQGPENPHAKGVQAWYCIDSSSQWPLCKVLAPHAA